MIKSRRKRWAGHVARMRDRKYVYRVLVGNLRERERLGDPDVDGRVIFKVDVQEVGCGGMDWMELTQDIERWWALVNAVMNFQVP